LRAFSPKEWLRAGCSVPGAPVPVLSLSKDLDFVAWESTNPRVPSISQHHREMGGKPQHLTWPL
jgi:hypothetical protein